MSSFMQDADVLHYAVYKDSEKGAHQQSWVNNGLPGFVVKLKKQEGKNDQTKQKTFFFFAFFFPPWRKEEREIGCKEEREKRDKKLKADFCLVGTVQAVLSITADENRYSSGQNEYTMSVVSNVLCCMP